jgi:chromosomal replication initiator protein
VSASHSEIADIWGEVLADLHTQTPRASVETWLKNIVPLSMDGDEVVLGVPSEFARDWLERGYSEVVEEAVGGVLGREVRVRFTVHPAAQTPEPAPQAVAAPSEEGEPALGFYSIPLNRKYTFENFVVGDSNRFAQAAGLAVATNPGRKYNPLFVHGGVGLGKTHLMQAIGHYVRERQSNSQVVYVPGETFVYHVVSSIRENKTDLFRKKYRSVDIWLVDDVQFIAAKERTEAEFFHTFNALYETHKQIVITSDCPPRDLQLINDRLRSRFEWGLIVDVGAPDLETRVAILQKKLEPQGTPLPYEVLHYIATLIPSNIRVLEGALLKVLAVASLLDRPVTLEDTQEALKDYTQAGAPFRITLERVMQAVCEHFGVSLDEVQSRIRSKNLVVPRQIAMYICREMTDHSLPDIGRYFKRDHSTVIHGHGKVRDLLDEDPVFAKMIEELMERIQHGHP